MLHPSYTDLINVVNSDVEPGEQPVVQSRYSIVLATAKRARQIALGSESMTSQKDPNPVTEAAQEIEEGKIIIYNSEEWKENKEKRNKDVI